MVPFSYFSKTTFPSLWSVNQIQVFSSNRSAWLFSCLYGLSSTWTCTLIRKVNLFVIILFLIFLLLLIIFFRAKTWQSQSRGTPSCPSCIGATTLNKSSLSQFPLGTLWLQVHSSNWLISASSSTSTSSTCRRTSSR